MDTEYLNEVPDPNTGEIGFHGVVDIKQRERKVRLVPYDGERHTEKSPEFLIYLEAAGGQFWKFGVAWRKKNKSNAGEHLQLMFQEREHMPSPMWFKAHPPQKGTKDQPGVWGLSWDRPSAGNGVSNAGSGGFE